MKLELKRWLTAPLRMNRRQALILCIFLAIFAGALFIRLFVTFGHGIPLGRDGPYNMYNTVYVLEHWPSMAVTDPPLFFHFGALTHVTLSPFGSTLMSSFHVATALASGLVALTVFVMMRRLTGDSRTALAAAFFSAFVPASFRMMGELQKNAFGVALVPLFVFFLWRGLEGGKKLDLVFAGVALGAVGLTHELAFGTLAIAYVSYLAFLLAYRRRIPWREIKFTVVIALIAGLICGLHYYEKLGSIAGMSGEETAPDGAPKGEFSLQQPQDNQPPEGPTPQGQPSVYTFYGDYIGQLLFVLAAFGVGVAVYRRRASDFFLLAWGMSALAMAQPWVVQGYQWRFVIMLATPAALLAGVGLIDGLGSLCWKAGEKIRTFSGQVRADTAKALTMVGRVVFVMLVMFVVVIQAAAANHYAWNGEMLQPQITTEEYNALQDFHDQVGDVYVFGSDRYLYWVDLVGLKGQIENAEVWNLSCVLCMGPETQSVSADGIANQWYFKQQEVGETIYAVVSEGPGQTEALENGELFALVFSQSSIRAYKLSENFQPSQPPQGPAALFAFSAAQPPPDNQPPGDQFPEGQPGGQEEVSGESSPVVQVLLAPVYVLPGSAAKFLVGVPLTVMLWVLLPCLGWALISRSVESGEKWRKVLVACLVLILVLMVVLVVSGTAPMMQQGSGIQPGSYPQ